MLEELLSLLQCEGYSREDARRLVNLYPEIVCGAEAGVAAAILERRAERFRETEPQKYLRIVLSDLTNSRAPAMAKLTVQVRTHDNLLQLLANGESPAWVISPTKERVITN